MNTRLVVVLSVVVIALLAAAFLVNLQPGVTSSRNGSSSSSSTATTQFTTSTGTGGSYVNSSRDLQLRLSVNASSSSGANGGVTIQIGASEYNTLAGANNVSKADQWGLGGLSLGACGTEAYPFGVALYNGSYSAGNVSQATPLHIYPFVACPMLIRLVTGYLFQPMSDLAVILPSGSNATATPMSANVTATAVYTSGASLSSTPLGPGTYTAAAGDEWGSIVVVHLTVGASSSASSTSTSTVTGQLGTLGASFSIGPTEPVCSANASIGPAPQPYASIAAVVNSSSGQVSTFPISWDSNGCEVLGVVQASLAPGSYSLTLSSCTFLGCRSALPQSFVIVAGQPTSVDVSIDTGIR